jgi:acyl-CoA thioesterase
MRPDNWMAARVRTTVATDGFFEEDGQLWAPDRTLIAHSRQLGLLQR